MDSRERLLTAPDGKVPDRVPISTYGVVGCHTKSWENNDLSYVRLMDVIRQKTDCICMWGPSQKMDYQTERGDDLSIPTYAPTESAYRLETEVKPRWEGKTVTCHKTLHTPYIGMLAYKGDWYGCQVEKVNRWYPSSKTCSVCGAVMEAMPLHVHEEQCLVCDFAHDRDVSTSTVGEPREVTPGDSL